MKTKWVLIPVIALSLGCTREIDRNVILIDGQFSLFATSDEKETRTVIQQDGSIFWNPKDYIKVFYGNTSGEFTSTNTEPAASAEFTGSLGSFVLDGETEFKAVYPYSDATILSGDNLRIDLPSEQTAVEGTFANNLFISVAKSKDVNLHFYNVCGGVCFSLARGDIKKVIFKGNNGEFLAGRLSVGFASNGVPQVTEITSGKVTVTLLAPNDGTFTAGSWYYLVLVPQVLTKGFTMELYTDELVETISSDSSATVRRSAWGVLKNLGSTSPSVSIPEAIDLGLSVKWASFNLGASKPEGYGDFYAWGETEPYYRSQDPLIWKDGKPAGYDWTSYKWCMGSNTTLTKYSNVSSYGYNGFTDAKTVLDSEDDAAQVNLGGNWKIPTRSEWEELMVSCTLTWTTRNGVNGRLFKASNGNSIFLPAAGNREGYTLNGVNSAGYYWSSSLVPAPSYQAWSVAILSSGGGMNPFGRYNGFSVRPVLDAPIVSVTGVSLVKTSLSMTEGDTYMLTATISPSNATDKTVTWSSDNTSVANVSSSGVVTAKSAGNATITVTTNDGGKKATCAVTVNAAAVPVPEAIDLGLSVKWASFNLGASKPEGYGDYYAWGETEPYYSSQDPLVWKDGKTGGYRWASYRWSMGFYYTMTKYCNYSSYGYNGFTDTKTILDSEDDAAHMNLGGSWRMPTDAEWTELRENCTWTWTTQNGINGRLVTASNGNSIFLPAAGYRIITDLYDAGSYGYYWSSSLDTLHPCGAMREFFNHSTVNGDDDNRDNGFSVRPVCE